MNKNDQKASDTRPRCMTHDFHCTHDPCRCTSDPADVIAEYIRSNMPGSPPATEWMRKEATGVLDALAAAGLAVVPEDRPATTELARLLRKDAEEVGYNSIPLYLPRHLLAAADALDGSAAPVPDDDTRREREALADEIDEVLARTITVNGGNSKWRKLVGGTARPYLERAAAALRARGGSDA